MAHWPATDRSRVVVVRHTGVWAADEVDPEIVLLMLDSGLSALGDTPDPAAVWRALFDPGERVLLKVNCIAYGGPTQPAVTYAVAQPLQDANPAERQPCLFDDRPLPPVAVVDHQRSHCSPNLVGQITAARPKSAFEEMVQNLL